MEMRRGPEGNGADRDLAPLRLGATMKTAPSGNEPPFLTFVAILMLVWLAASAIAFSWHYL
jgi:hypothetical protein